MSPRAPTPDAPEPAELAWPEDRPELLPFLPLIYVAWADGVLAPGELHAIRVRIERQDWLDPEARAAVGAWLEPEHPPSPTSLERLKERLRTLGPGPAGETRRSLVSLGLDLARANGFLGANAGAPWPEKALEALDELEAALGVVGHEAVRDLLAPEHAPPEPGARSFDATALRDFLAQPHAEHRQRILSLLAEPAFQFQLELERPEYRRRVMDALQRLADEGLGGLAFPSEHGGEDAPARALATFETLAFGDLSLLVKYGVQFGLFGGSVHQLGTARHHARYLGPIARLELPGCYAMTETGHGSNVRDLETTATYDADTDELVVHTPVEQARKDWIGNAALHGRMATVFAQLRVGEEDHGVHAILVPLRNEDGEPLPGVDIEDCGAKEGLNGVDNGILRFDRVRVPRENLLDRFASITPEGRYQSPIPSAGRRFFTMLGTLVAGRISIAAAAVSAAKTGLAIAVPYSERRRQFGPAGGPEVPLLDYLVHQRLLLPRLAATYAYHFAVRDLTARYERLLTGGASDQEAGRVEIEGLAAGVKALASWHCVDTLQACREACGGQGYLAANRFARLKADTDVFTTFEGANVVLLQLVARGLLSDYKEEMGDLKLWDIVRYLADRAQTRVVELNPLVTRRTDDDHLRDPDFHAAAFEYREARLVASAARRLSALIRSGVDSFEAMNQSQDHLVAMARAHVERRVLESFHEAVVRASTPGLSETLRSLAVLHALSHLEDDRGWYLESGYFEAGKARAIRAQVNAMCGELREEARLLVDGFGIPADVLRAPAAE